MNHSVYNFTNKSMGIIALIVTIWIVCVVVYYIIFPERLEFKTLADLNLR